MKIFRLLNKVLGAILLTLLFAPLVVLATISRLFNFIDLLSSAQILQSVYSIILSPFAALATAVIGITSLLVQGWDTGLVSLIRTVPMRTTHFFKKQLPFGREKNQSANDLFENSATPSGLNEFVTPDFFGQLTAKLLSLCLPMELYLSHDAKTVSPHNDVSIYFTEKNLSLLKEKYGSIESDQSVEIVMEINAYLTEKLEAANVKKQDEKISSSAGRLQSAQDEIYAIQSAQRSVTYFATNKKTAPDLANQFKCTTATVLNYIWLAIKTECPNEYNKQAMRDKLIWTLFQIQRGFNIQNDGNGPDMPECPSGAIGLLVRVICNEQEEMPASAYEAADPNPTNLSGALKIALDRPFTSSYAVIMKTSRKKYEKDKVAYKQEQKDNIMKTWKSTYSTLLNSGVLKTSKLEEIIDEGLNDWEPPCV